MFLKHLRCFRDLLSPTRIASRTRRGVAERCSAKLRSTELLEDRALLAPLVVNTTADSGPGSLRQAILDANMDDDHDDIKFELDPFDAKHMYYQNDGVSGQVSHSHVANTTAADDSTIGDIDPDHPHSWWTLRLLNDLPTITQPVHIDGYTQFVDVNEKGMRDSGESGAKPNTLPVGTDAVLRIELDGSSAGLGDGLVITADNSTVSGLVINGFGVGIRLQDATSNNNTIQGNYVGTDPSGSFDKPNTRGIFLRTGASKNTIGSDGIGMNNEAERNIISGNVLDGVFINSWPGGISEKNNVSGNYIGTDADGTNAIPNGRYGVLLSRSLNERFPGASGEVARNVVGLDGSTGAGVKNVISGNTRGGVAFGWGAHSNDVFGNLIGTTADSEGALGNGDFGVGVGTTAHSNRIGDVGGGLGNTIAFNNGPGVAVLDSTFQSGESVPDTSINIAIRGNSIYSNTGIGIDLGGEFNLSTVVTTTDGFTDNDVGDGDDGANNLQNYPILTSVTAGQATQVIGVLDTNPGVYTIDFYASTPTIKNLDGEGERWLASKLVTVPGSGIYHFNETLSAFSAPGEYITATATDSSGNTSEFSSVFIATGLTESGDLITGGGNGDDDINISQGSVIVTVNGVVALVVPDETSVGRIIAHGLDGQDVITIDQALSIPAELNGGDGDDQLTGGSGDDVLIGGDGDDELDGGEGGDSLDAGEGNNTITADSNDVLGDISLAVLAPLSLTPGSHAVRGQPLMLAADATDPLISIDWDLGDGASASGATVEHVYQHADDLIVTATMQNSSGATNTVHQTLHITTAALQIDSEDPLQTVLAAGGSLADDVIDFKTAGNQGDVELVINSQSWGVFGSPSRLLAFGQAGADDIQANASLAASARFFGGDGDDRLKGGGAHDVLLGEAGDDLLIGHSGRDLLIGGVGADRIVGNTDDDILIAGVTLHDTHQAALAAIMQEWTRSDNTHEERVQNLTTNAQGNGLNGTILLNANTVFHDNDEDKMTGASGLDWFFFDEDNDKVTDLNDEAFANDLDYILS